MNLDTEQVLKVLHPSGVVEQTATGLPCDKQIEIALLVGFAASNGAKHARPVRAMKLGQTEDLVPPFAAQAFEHNHKPTSTASASGGA
jgi:hypothetical protein